MFFKLQVFLETPRKMLTLGNDSILFCASLFSPYAALVGFLKFKQIEKNWSKLIKKIAEDVASVI